MTAGGAALVAFLAGLAFSRGVMRQIFGMIGLGLGTLAGTYVFQHRQEVLGEFGAKLTTDQLLMVSGGVGLGVYLLCKSFVRLLAGLGIVSVIGGVAGWKGGLISLIPSGFLLWASTLLLRFVGGVYDVESAAAAQQPGTPKGLSGQVAGWLHQFTQQVDRSAVGVLAAKLDPYDVRATANLARLLILWPDGSVWQQLASSDPAAAKALNHPRLVALGTDPEVRRAIENRDFAGLLQLRQVVQTAADPELGPFLKSLTLDQAMDRIVYRPR